MTLLLSLLFWLALGALVHTYVVYPALLRKWSRGRSNNTLHYQPEEIWPRVSVICSLYNEEAVIVEKMTSLRDLDYPADRLQFYMGSDCSSDGTNDLMHDLAKTWNGNAPTLYFFPFAERRGKPPVVNELVEKATAQNGVGPDHILLITDANVMLTPNTLNRMIRHFKNPAIAVVDAHMQHTGMRADGISQAEHTYISGEVLLKHREGVLWQKMIGPFGGCYAIRSDYFTPVPPRFLVDDFFIAMSAFQRGGGAISDLEAVCYEAVSHDMQEEYRRKRRISSGNFQNMRHFRHLWWPPTSILGFAFFSHKILRWLGPFLLIGLLLSSGLLALLGNIVFKWLFGSLVGGMAGVVIADRLARAFGWNVLPLRGAHYFLYMNLALLEGFINYLKGIKSNVWQPPKRNH